MKSDLYGLVLVGGESQRMGRDKALLTYDGSTTQLDRSAALLKQVCTKVFVSQREEQSFPASEDTEAIYDTVEDVKGPLCGIVSAMRAYPHAHWLVLACDLPYVKTSTLKKLISEFRAQAPRLTAYRSSHDGLPEPLCAIYPSGCDTELLTLAVELGKNCPRKLLIIKKARLIDQDDLHSLDNINTADEYEAATQIK